MKRLLCGLMIVLFCAGTLSAQSKTETAFSLRPYIWAAALEGEAAVDGVAVPVDVPFEQTWENLDGALLLNAEAQRGRWGVMLDGVWLKISDSSGTPGPFLSLVVSGGHTCLVRVDSMDAFTLLGQTIDDAAGEAFDKGAALLGLGYPGGPIIDRTARGADVTFVRFPRGRPRAGSSPCGDLNPELCFSFSGLKTSLLYHLKANPLSESRTELPDLVASYQEAIVDALGKRVELAIDLTRKEDLQLVGVAAAGGVAANRSLQDRLERIARRKGLESFRTPLPLCTDNGAMIAGLGAHEYLRRGPDPLHVPARPGLGFREPLEGLEKTGEGR